MEADPQAMKDDKYTLVVSADRMGGSVIIYFDNGRTGVYSSELLYAILPQASEIHEPDAEAELVPERGRAA